jgi:ribosomal protein L11 methyltransferase
MSAAVKQQSLDIPPFWRIRPPGSTPETGVPLFIDAGAGFGDGGHETTQLCLQAVAAAPRTPDFRVLDFGAGSGILAIAAARLGARVDAVEIDPAAIEHAERNARANGVSAQVRFQPTLAGFDGPYDLVVANILRNVLLAEAEELTRRLGTGKLLALSGLVATDVPGIIARHSPLLAGRRPEVHRRGEWCAVVFWPS